MTGKFLSIEGIEGAGKSTQLRFIEQYLTQHGKIVLVTREPGGTPLGEQIREVLLAPRSSGMSVDAELLLMFAARVEHLQQKISPALARGEWVLTDRFVDASFAYQGAGRQIATTRIQQLADWALQGINTDMTFLFDLPVAAGQQRVMQRGKQKDRFEQEKSDFFEMVRACYLKRAAAEPQRLKIIDANQSITHIQQQLVPYLDQLLASGS